MDFPANWKNEAARLAEYIENNLADEPSREDEAARLAHASALAQVGQIYATLAVFDALLAIGERLEASE